MSTLFFFIFLFLSIYHCCAWFDLTWSRQSRQLRIKTRKYNVQRNGPVINLENLAMTFEWTNFFHLIIFLTTPPCQCCCLLMCPNNCLQSAKSASNGIFIFELIAFSLSLFLFLSFHFISFICMCHLHFFNYHVLIERWTFFFFSLNKQSSLFTCNFWNAQMRARSFLLPNQIKNNKIKFFNVS